jgi:hypothetical protein
VQICLNPHNDVQVRLSRTPLLPEAVLFLLNSPSSFLSAATSASRLDALPPLAAIVGGVRQCEGGDSYCRRGEAM